jgi:DNA replication initiation complex subunit (GINS family)
MTGAHKAKNKSTKLTKSDPDFYSKIAKMAGRKLLKRRGKGYFSKLAAKSHPRAEYNGGRPKKKKTTSK